MNQGEVWLVNLDPTIHTEIGKTRPGIIVSVNAMNRNSPRLIVAPISSAVGKIYPFEVFVPSGSGGLLKNSKIMLDQIRSLDKRRLVKKIGTVDKSTLKKSCSIAHMLLSTD